MKNTINYHFCLDIGGTNTRGALFNLQGKELYRAKGPAGALSLGANQCFNSINIVWSDIKAQHEKYNNSNLLNPKQVKLTAGIAGIGLPEQASKLVKLLEKFSENQLMEDGYGALIAATKGKSGALISVGTGVGALSLNDEGKIQFASSWGFPAGDTGSGAWIGLILFSDFLKSLDGIISQPHLSKKIIKDILAMTGNDPSDIMQWHIQAKPKDYAALAPLIVNGVEENDAYCINMLEKAAKQISQIANILMDKDSSHVYLSGGLGKVILPFCIKQNPTINWALSNADPITGVFLIATGNVKNSKTMPRLGLR